MKPLGSVAPHIPTMTLAMLLLLGPFVHWVEEFLLFLSGFICGLLVSSLIRVFFALFHSHFTWTVAMGVGEVAFLALLPAILR